MSSHDNKDKSKEHCPSSSSGCCQNVLATAKVGQPAPCFKGTAVFPDGSFKEVSLSDYKGKYLLLYFYPLDFTYVCPTEIIAFGKACKDFKSKSVEILGCSVDSHFTHLAWMKTAKSQGGLGGLQHPLLSDLTKEISKKYNVLVQDQGIALRGLFLIDKQGIIQHMLINNLPLGRSVDEAMRMVDSLQHVEQHGEVCPADWKKGSKAMEASSEGMCKYLSSI